MSEDDPFDDLDDAAADREGDPFDHLEGPPEDADEPSDGVDEAFRGADETPPTGPETGYDAHDVTPGGHRDELDEAGRERDDGGRAAGDAAGDPAADERARGPDDQAADEWAAGPGDSVGETAGEYRAGPGVHGQGAEPAPGPDSDPAGEVDDPFGEGGPFEEVDVGDLDPDQVWAELSDAQERGSVSDVQGRAYAEVSKHSYCEQCEFFSAPPDVSCAHEGTEILEFPDMDTVRVVDCPIVAERQDLQEE